MEQDLAIQFQILLKFIDANLIIIAVVLYLLGDWIKVFLKKYDKENFIPLLLWGVGSLMVFGWVVLYTQDKAFNAGTIVYCIVQGALASGLAVNANQMYIQIAKYYKIGKYSTKDDTTKDANNV